MEPLSVPPDVTSFKEISLDWITRLSISRCNDQEYNSILTIVCHVMKYALFISTCKDTIAVDLAELFFKHVKCHFGTPKGVVIDRDSCIMSEFWREIYKIQIIKRCLLTIYHS